LRLVTVTALRTDCQEIVIQICSSPNRPYWFQGHQSLLFKRYRDLFPSVKWVGAWDGFVASRRWQCSECEELHFYLPCTFMARAGNT